jgi:AraC-like DNA-binding protein
MLQIYSTETVQEAERISFWKDAVCQSYCPAECAPLTERHFDGAIQLHHFGPAVVSHVRSSPVQYARAQGDLNRDARDVFYVALTECAEAYVIQDGRESRQKRGDIVMFDNARPYACGFPQGDDQIICAIPREMMLQYLPHADALSAVTLSASAPMVPLATGMLRQTAALPRHAAPAVTTRLGMSLIEVLALTIEASLAAPATGLGARQRELLDRIKKYIRDNIGDADLSLDQVADAHHISNRTLNRLFAAEGTTAVRWLWQLRLMTSYRLLSDKQTNQVSTAAIECGFSNFSHFTSAFKKNFGITPHDLLKKATST